MMKFKLFSVALLFVFAATGVFAQQKYALVIGNQNYSGISTLKNPVNDANDMEATLKGLGFTVEKVLNGDLEQMEKAVGNLKRSLGASPNAYGFFFYAGHGVQSNGENYLIPVEANNIQNETHLRQRAVSLQFILDSLSEAGNELNMIVLDACRDNPFSWARSGSRGLSVVSQAPTGSIVMYATGANSTAADGTGTNGLFTGHLLNNLKTPGLSVFDVFDRTMDNVINVTNGTQHPELSLRYAGATRAYLGSRSAQPTPTPQPAPRPVPVNPSPSRTAYNIGDRGPAGGIIFYDQGEFKDGWRYMEAAPADTEMKDLPWGAHGKDVSGTRMDLGAGKSNTQIIIRYLRENNEGGRAAQVCTQLNFGGYTDWFLPSRDELYWMYFNLHSKGHGGFKNARYWSSSQVNKNRAWYLHFGDNGRASNNYDKTRNAFLYGEIWTRAARAF
jgi:hypothetical protein